MFLDSKIYGSAIYDDGTTGRVFWSFDLSSKNFVVIYDGAGVDQKSYQLMKTPDGKVFIGDYETETIQELNITTGLTTGSAISIGYALFDPRPGKVVAAARHPDNVRQYKEEFMEMQEGGTIQKGCKTNTVMHNGEIMIADLPLNFSPEIKKKFRDANSGGMKMPILLESLIKIYDWRFSETPEEFLDRAIEEAFTKFPRADISETKP